MQLVWFHRLYCCRHPGGEYRPKELAIVTILASNTPQLFVVSTKT